MTDELIKFHQGEQSDLYRFFGAHKIAHGGKDGYLFRVYAPHAREVSVVGDFNGWNGENHKMCRLEEGECFELFIEGLKEFDLYKYRIVSRSGKVLFKADPVGFFMENPPKTSSKIYTLEGYEWGDGEYQKRRLRENIYASPMNIYEVSLLSWKRHEDKSYYTYRELAQELVPYVKEMGYTHVEFMPVLEFPFDGSWGYQPTGYFAATSRLGTPKDLMYLVDCFHRENIKVIFDWVPAHFPKDEHGLYEFDGEPLYESELWHLKEHAQWGTRRFDYGKGEVVSFLISSACLLFDYFHADGIRVDAVASMLYLDYDKRPGEWVPNIYGENKNLEAISFLRKLNESVYARFPYALMIAEESTAWGLVTKPPYVGGLGFSHKWNMGWMNDMLSYLSIDPYFRIGSHNKLTFSMMYAFTENFVLPVSHDEVVHGKGSLIGKMPGTYEDKFAGVRAFLGYMFAHPGKKLNFMGYEFGQFKEWDFSEGLEFFLRDKYEYHGKLSEYVKTLNFLYKSFAPFFEIEDSWAGFEWLAADDADRNIVAFLRRDKSGQELLCVISFSGADADDYMLGVNEKTKYRLILNSDDKKFGGRGKIGKKSIFAAISYPTHGKRYSIRLPIPKHTCLYFVKEPVKEKNS